MQLRKLAWAMIFSVLALGSGESIAQTYGTSENEAYYLSDAYDQTHKLILYIMAKDIVCDSENGALTFRAEQSFDGTSAVKDITFVIDKTTFVEEIKSGISPDIDKFASGAHRWIAFYVTLEDAAKIEAMTWTDSLRVHVDSVVGISKFVSTVSPHEVGQSEPQTDTAAIQKQLEEYRVLNYERETFSPDGTVTRGKMAEIIGRLHGYGTPHGGVSAEVCFEDVDLNHPDYVWILMAKNSALVCGDENGCFRPDEAVSGVDAVKTLLSFAGYDWMASACGGYPQGYQTAAKLLGLIDRPEDVSAAPVSKDSLLHILNRYLDVPEARMDENGTVFLVEGNPALQETGAMRDWIPRSLRTAENS